MGKIQYWITNLILIAGIWVWPCYQIFSELEEKDTYSTIHTQITIAYGIQLSWGWWVWWASYPVTVRCFHGLQAYSKTKFIIGLVYFLKWVKNHKMLITETVQLLHFCNVDTEEITKDCLAFQRTGFACGTNMCTHTCSSGWGGRSQKPALCSVLHILHLHSAIDLPTGETWLSELLTQKLCFANILVGYVYICLPFDVVL